MPSLPPPCVIVPGSIHCTGLYSVFGRVVLSNHAYLVWGANGAARSKMPTQPGLHCFKAGSANSCRKASK